VQEDGQQSEFNRPLRQGGLRAGEMASVQHPRHAQRDLKGVFEIVVTRVNGLIIACFPVKQSVAQRKIAGDKIPVRIEETFRDMPAEPLIRRLPDPWWPRAKTSCARLTSGLSSATIL
jgi:hypothetical protein